MKTPCMQFTLISGFGCPELGQSKLVRYRKTDTPNEWPSRIGDICDEVEKWVNSTWSNTPFRPDEKIPYELKEVELVQLTSEQIEVIRKSNALFSEE